MSHTEINGDSGVSPFLDGDHQQVVEEEEVDGAELPPHVEERCSFRHLLELSSLLQISVLGDDRHRLARRRQSSHL